MSRYQAKPGGWNVRETGRSSGRSTGRSTGRSAGRSLSPGSSSSSSADSIEYENKSFQSPTHPPASVKKLNHESVSATARSSPPKPIQRKARFADKASMGAEMVADVRKSGKTLEETGVKGMDSLGTSLPPLDLSLMQPLHLPGDTIAAPVQQASLPAALSQTPTHPFAPYPHPSYPSYPYTSYNYYNYPYPQCVYPNAYPTYKCDPKAATRCPQYPCPQSAIELTDETKVWASHAEMQTNPTGPGPGYPWVAVDGKFMEEIRTELRRVVMDGKVIEDIRTELSMLTARIQICLREELEDKIISRCPPKNVLHDERAAGRAKVRRDSYYSSSSSTDSAADETTLPPSSAYTQASAKWMIPESVFTPARSLQVEPDQYSASYFAEWSSITAQEAVPDMPRPRVFENDFNVQAPDAVWDPLGSTSDGVEASLNRTIELKHGCVCMMAIHCFMPPEWLESGNSDALFSFFTLIGGFIDFTWSETTMLPEFSGTFDNDHIVAYFNELKLNARDALSLLKLLDKNGGGSIEIDENAEGRENMKGEFRALHLILGSLSTKLDKVVAYLGIGDSTTTDLVFDPRLSYDR